MPFLSHSHTEIKWKMINARGPHFNRQVTHLSCQHLNRETLRNNDFFLAMSSHLLNGFLSVDIFGGQTLNQQMHRFGADEKCICSRTDLFNPLLSSQFVLISMKMHFFMCGFANCDSIWQNRQSIA